ITFTLLGILFSGGMAFAGASFSRTFGRIAGVIVMLLGLNIIFDVIGFLNSDVRLIQKLTGRRDEPGRGAWLQRGSMLNAFLMGLAFAAGWSPCIGPILASVLLMAARNADAGHAAVLLAAYSAGFAVPFILSALFFARLAPLLAFLKKHGNSVRVISGIFLLLFGLVMFLGSVSMISARAAQAGGILLNFRETSPMAARVTGAVFWLLLSLPSLRALHRWRTEHSSDRAWRGAIPALATGISLTLALLEMTGLFSIVQAMGTWLTFSGI
ncbi:MAG: cytochrome c biogenesis protein CcdA, partial [Rectinema sp.]|nr:cytochrome c biogenesis protein CcdA [Rectinema sp.]